MIYNITTDFILLIVKNGETLPELHLFLTIKYNNSENIKLLFTKWRHKFFTDSFDLDLSMVFKYKKNQLASVRNQS